MTVATRDVFPAVIGMGSAEGWPRRRLYPAGRLGWPRALFALNLWSIGDIYAPPQDLVRYTRQYRIESRKGDARLVRFIGLVFRAFRPEIEALQVQKERAIQRYRAAHDGTQPSGRALITGLLRSAPGPSR